MKITLVKHYVLMEATRTFEDLSKRENLQFTQKKYIMFLLIIIT